MPRFGMAVVRAATAALGVCIGFTDARGNEPPSDPRLLQIKPSASIFLKAPAVQGVAFRGHVSFDDAGNKAGAAVLYPAPNLLVGLVAVLTHGAVVEAAKNAEKTKLQTAADQVLQPHQTSIADMRAADLVLASQALLGKALPARRFAADVSSADWIVETLPVYTMLQDQLALILDNTIAVYAASDSQTVLYRGAVRVISPPVKRETELVAYWGHDSGKRLRDMSARLHAQSLEVWLAQAARDADSSPQAKTVRYLEGRTERFERAQVISEACGRVVMMNLRGWLMAVPAARRSTEAQGAADCPDPLDD